MVVVVVAVTVAVVIVVEVVVIKLHFEQSVQQYKTEIWTNQNITLLIAYIFALKMIAIIWVRSIFVGFCYHILHGTFQSNAGNIMQKTKYVWKESLGIILIHCRSYLPIMHLSQKTIVTRFTLYKVINYSCGPRYFNTLGSPLLFRSWNSIVFEKYTKWSLGGIM